MIVEYIRYEIGRNDGDALIGAISAAGANLIADPGCRRWEVVRGVTDDTAFILRVEWVSGEAIESFRDTSGFKRVLDALAPYSNDGKLELFRTVGGSELADLTEAEANFQ